MGLDEVGRGAWAGPLVMGAVIFRSWDELDGLRDSKLLSATARERMSREIYERADCGIGIVPVAELNDLGLTAGLELAAQRAIAGVGITPDHCLFDGNALLKHISIPQTAVIRGDQQIRCVAAASVIAKVYRDQLMRELHESDSRVQIYRFDLNKGYPSPLHRAQLELHGASAHHRTFFAPIRELNQLRIWSPEG